MANISHFTQTVNGVSTTYDIHDANAVDLTNNQTVGGIKTFSNAPVVNSINLDGKSIDTDANGNMTFNGHIVDTIEEQGNGYIRYSNGIQICWIEAEMENSAYKWSFPKTFLQIPVVTATAFYPSDAYNIYQRSVELNNLSSTGVLLREAVHQFGSNIYVIASDYIEAIAIGRWK